MKYCEPNLSKWLLTATVLLGIFLSPGGNYSNLRNNVKAQTELVYSAKSKNISVDFKKVTFTFRRHPFLSYFTNHPTSLLLTYNKLIKVKFDCNSKLSRSIDQTEKFIQAKYIPSGSSEDLFISVG